MTPTRSRQPGSALRRSFTLGLLAMLAVAVAIQLPGGSAQAQPAGDDALTPILQSVKSSPHWYPADDGRVHLQYEVLLTNATSVPIDVVELDVLSGAGSPISSLSGAQLKKAMGFTATDVTTTLGPYDVSVAWIDLSFPNRKALPKRVKHRLTAAPPPELLPPITDTSAKVRIDPRAPMQISPPVRGSDWVAVVGPHRRSLQPINGNFHLAQRFAIDFSAKLDDQDRTHLGPNDENESYFNYGEPLLAVGAGKVVAAVDEYPDAVPPNSPAKVDFAQAGGNRVIIKLADGVFAGYGHMKPGSVRVEVGDRVRVGQVLGKLGNSGNSSGPHLHFQLMSRPSFLGADGLPFRLDRFRLLGRVPSLDALIENDLSGDPVPIDRSVAGRFRNTGFSDLDVVSFPGG